MIIIDAQSKKLGRVASEAAKALMGKHLSTYTRNRTADIDVRIINAASADISERKLKKLVYSRYSGYPGGLKRESGAHLKERKGVTEIFRRAVSGMLPDNSLKRNMMKRLSIQ